MDMALKDRIREAMQACNMSSAQLSMDANVTPAAVSGWLSGNTKTLKGESATAIERATGYRAEWIVSGKLPKKVSELQIFGEPVAALGVEESLPSSYVQIKESLVRFAAGNGRTAMFEEIAESVPRTYRRDWFVREGINPANARAFKVRGDSMEPTLYDGDTVLVNLAEIDIINGRVYALRYGDELKLKRVYRRLDGGLILHSDNPNFLPRDEELLPQIVQEHIGIIGRVRDKSGAGGL